MNTSSVARRVPSDRFVRVSQLTAPVLMVACLLVTAGCAQRVYGPPPPPLAFAPNALVAEADHRGFRAGAEDGARDAASRTGYHPRRDRWFAETPGYDPGMGPYGPYRDTFRNAYLRGYEDGFRRR